MEGSGRENHSDDEKWEGGAKSDQSEDEEEKRPRSDEERENSDDEAPRHRKSGRCRRCQWNVDTELATILYIFIHVV